MDKFCSLAGKDMLLKPAAAIASARRAGTTATLDVLLKYFSFHQMPIVSSNYWNMGTRQHSGWSTSGQRRNSDHACSRQKYGMASALSGSRKKCWNFKTGIRREGKDKLYPLNLWFFNTSRIVFHPGCVFFLKKYDFTHLHKNLKCPLSQSWLHW